MQETETTDTYRPPIIDFLFGPNLTITDLKVLINWHDEISKIRISVEQKEKLHLLDKLNDILKELNTLVYEYNRSDPKKDFKESFNNIGTFLYNMKLFQSQKWFMGSNFKPSLERLQSDLTESELQAILLYKRDSLPQIKDVSLQKAIEWFNNINFLNVHTDKLGLVSEILTHYPEFQIDLIETNKKIDFLKSLNIIPKKDTLYILSNCITLLLILDKFIRYNRGNLLKKPIRPTSTDIFSAHLKPKRQEWLTRIQKIFDAYHTLIILSGKVTSELISKSINTINIFRSRMNLPLGISETEWDLEFVNFETTNDTITGWAYVIRHENNVIFRLPIHFEPDSNYGIVPNQAPTLIAIGPSLVRDKIGDPLIITTAILDKATNQLKAQRKPIIQGLNVRLLKKDL